MPSTADTINPISFEEPGFVSFPLAPLDLHPVRSPSEGDIFGLVQVTAVHGHLETRAAVQSVSPADSQLATDLIGHWLQSYVPKNLPDAAHYSRRFVRTAVAEIPHGVLAQVALERIAKNNTIILSANEALGAISIRLAGPQLALEAKPKADDTDYDCISGATYTEEQLSISQIAALKLGAALLLQQTTAGHKHTV